MEQTISFRHPTPSPFHDSFVGTHATHERTLTRRRRSNATMHQAHQTPHFTLEAQSSTYPHLLPLPSSSFDHLARINSLPFLRQTHARIIRTAEEWSSDQLLEQLIIFYSVFGDFRSAAMVFVTGFERGNLSWTHLIDLYHHGPCSSEFLGLLCELHRIGMVFSSRVFTMALRISAQFVDLWLGLQIHAFLIKIGLDSDSYLVCSLMDFYADCVSLEFANGLFEMIPMKSCILWNKVVTLNAERGQWLAAVGFFQKMQTLRIEADEVTIAKVVHACGRLQVLREGKTMHGYVIRCGLPSNLLINNSLITMYAHNSLVELARKTFESIGSRSLVSWNSIISCYALNGFLDDALELFNEMVSSGLQPDLVSWNCLISGHSLHGSDVEVLELFRRMQAEGLKPNSSTITSVLRVVSDSGLIKFGREMHSYAIRHWLLSSIYVGTSLTDMYVKCHHLSNARKVFDAIKHRNVCTWNSLISGYAHDGFLDEALKLLKQMEREGVRPDLTTWNGLITGYMMKGMSRQALMIIRQLKAAGLKPNVVSWTSIISGCCQNACYEDSLYYCREMQNDGTEPNSITLACILRACAALALLEKGAEVHCFALRRGLHDDSLVATGLIDMYSKSGSLKTAHAIFKNIQIKNLASWNAMIMAFAAHGRGKEAVLLFDEMCDAGHKPDGISFTAVLSACRHSGLISEGWKYFDAMTDSYRIAPTVEHYACMVDLLARGGYLDEAWEFIQTMPFEPDASLWGALLGACRNHRNVELAELAAKHLFKLEPYNPANYLLMMILYAYENRWEDFEVMRDAMNKAGVKSRAGWSWIQIGQDVHVFEVEGRPHPHIGEIYYELYYLVSEMKILGYRPDTSCIVHNVEEKEKEKLLMSHTEKLAITYGLISTDKNRNIRVITNTRVCNDCHQMAKFISKIRTREIVLRDGARFHHFKDGQCSCNDYW